MGGSLFTRGTPPCERYTVPGSLTTCYMEGKVVVYDSLPMKSLPEELNKQLRDLYGKDGKALDVSISEVQKQSNQIDCGCFAIAWAVLLAIGERPENITLNKKQLRP